MSRLASSRYASALAVAVLLSPSSSSAQVEALVQIKDLKPVEHRVEGFVLTSPQFLQIDATAAEPRYEDDHGWLGRDDERNTWPAAAWIIDARTRAVVWDIRDIATLRSRKGLRTFTGPIRLPAGLYEAHYASYVATSINTGQDKFISLGKKGVRVGNTTYRGPYVDDDSYLQFQFVISGAGRPARSRELKDAVRDYQESAVVSLQPDTSGETARSAFELGREADVEIYAIGEIRRESPFDYGWILNADTRKVVWRMDYKNSEDGGGAVKNRMVRYTQHLPAGKYVAYFTSDDSHGAGEWNGVPPFDPSFWGMTLRIEDQSARESVHKIDWSPVPEGQTIVSMVRMGDDETRSQGFSLKQGMDVRVYAIGECTDKKDPDMDDYAWIMNANTRTRIWTMQCDQTEPAGGAYKNRMFDGVVHLDAGNYMVFFKSDGSHSYAKWNDAPPVESKYWGVSVFPASGKLDPRLIGTLERDTVGILADLTKVRDDRKSRRFFDLESPTHIRIHAVGEGTGGEMDDYAWIEDEKTGETVWEMKYKNTVEAGGARKNRLFDGTVKLEPGRYILFFKTDGSHAYGDWNADPPDDPDSWGVVLRKE